MSSSFSRSGERQPRSIRSLPQLFAEADRLIASGDGGAAIELVRGRRELGEVAPCSYVLGLMGVCCRAGRPDEAADAASAALAAGCWWYPRLLTESPQFAMLAGHPELAGWLEHLWPRWKAAQARVEPVPPIMRTFTDGQAPRAVLVTLHGAGSTAASFSRLWARAAREAGVALVVPQGPLITVPDGGGLFGWLPETANRDVLDAYRTATAGALENLPVILAGFSQGAALAVSQSVGEVPLPMRLQGLIAVSPSTAVTSATRATIASRAGALRASVLVGEYDWARPATERLVTEMQAAGLALTFDQIPGVGHALDSRFSSQAAGALRFVLDD